MLLRACRVYVSLVCLVVVDFCLLRPLAGWCAYLEIFPPSSWSLRPVPAKKTVRSPISSRRDFPLRQAFSPNFSQLRPSHQEDHHRHSRCRERPPLASSFSTPSPSSVQSLGAELRRPVFRRGISFVPLVPPGTGGGACLRRHSTEQARKPGKCTAVVFFLHSVRVRGCRSLHHCVR